LDGRGTDPQGHARGGRSDADSSLIGYSSLLGSERMRTLLARRLEEQGVGAAPGQILLTESSTHALDLVSRFLLEPGDTVLVDDPCYFNFWPCCGPTGPMSWAFR
jgi:DNA-binding transcriptional MocR family regulator